MNRRTVELIGREKFDILSNATVAVIGLGGVGGFVAEELARCGTGNLILADGDIIEESNLNRQIIATKSNIGKNKAEEFKKRIENISNAKISIIPEFITKENLSSYLSGKIDFIADCIDNVENKVDLIKYAKDNNYPIISAMGAGNRYNLCKFEVADIYKTSGDGLAKKLRQKLREININSLDVVYACSVADKKERIIGSISYMPAIMGSTICGYIINKLIDK